MLKLVDLSVFTANHTTRKTLLKDVNLEFQSGQLIAVIGSSGCGKSTLLKAIAGLTRHTEGHMYWQGYEVGENHDIEPESLAYVPQFGIFHEELRVLEILTDAAILRTGILSIRLHQESIQQVAEVTGITHLLEREAKLLSGGQKRRLALAMELVSHPELILADEVTSGLDPKSEMEINLLLRRLATEGDRLILHVTHGLKHIDLYDRVVVLAEGNVVFFGSPEQLRIFFNVSQIDDLFQCLEDTGTEQWVKSWNQLSVDQSGTPLTVPTPIHESTTPLPKWVLQTFCLTRRRFRLFFRNRSQLILHLVLLFIFPLMVVLFALKGLPDIQNMSLDMRTNVVDILRDSLQYSSQVGRVGGLISGLAMFQVILLALMGSNNSAREIASERGIFEKEKLSGLNITSYLTSKIIFLGLLVLAQSLWMTLFVKTVCKLPGDSFHQFVILLLVNASLTSLSLAISSWSKTAEQASLIALYIVGFQLPLSGAVLALPDWLTRLTQPLIAAYWSWSGYLQTFKETQSYDWVTAVVPTTLEPWRFCVTLLCIQCLVGLGMAFIGCYRSAMND
jgi:ABC transport system ATP-binding/permease protein